MSEVSSEWISLPNVLLQVPRALQHQSAHHVRGLEQHQAAPVSVCSNVNFRMQTGPAHSNICTRGPRSSPPGVWRSILEQPSFPPLSSCCQVVSITGRQRRSVPAPTDIAENERIINTLPKVGQRFHIIIIIVFLDSNDSSLMAAAPNAYLLFKAQSLPPPTVCFTVGELMEVMWKEQGFISDFLQCKFETFDRVSR